MWGRKQPCAASQVTSKQNCTWFLLPTVVLMSDTVWHGVSVAHWCRELGLTWRHMTKLCLIITEAYIIDSALKKKKVTLLFHLFCIWPMLDLKSVFESPTNSFGYFSVSFQEHDTCLLHFPRLTPPIFPLSPSLILSLPSPPGFRRHRQVYG